MDKASRTPYRYIRPRNEGLGYEGCAHNGDVKLVKAKTSIEGELYTGGSAMR